MYVYQVNSLQGVFLQMIRASTIEESLIKVKKLWCEENVNYLGSFQEPDRFDGINVEY